MNELKEDKNSINNEGAPTILINIYAILAILFVLIPEWLAEFGIAIENDQYKTKLPKRYNATESTNYLYVSELDLKDLRLLAYKLKVNGYSNENKKSLKRRVIRKLEFKKSIKIILKTLRWNKVC